MCPMPRLRVKAGDSARPLRLVSGARMPPQNGDTSSTLAFLEGARSGSHYGADELRSTDPADGRTLLARYDLEVARGRLTKEAIAGRRGGLWRWEELLPGRRRSFITSLGEGSTPLLPPARLARKPRLSGLPIKAEGVNPTGPFNATGTPLPVSPPPHPGPAPPLPT